MSRHSLSRRRPTRDPRKRFVLLCEGQNTEPHYFNAVKELYADALVDIEIEGGVGVPETIARSAAKRSRALAKEAKSSFQENDEVWAVFDRDEHPNFDRAVDICRGAGVRVARSNPCFELWLVLHFGGYDKPGKAKDVQKHLRTLCDEYGRSNGKRVNCAPILSKIQEAEKRAQSQLKARERDGKAFSAPSTTVGVLTEAIRLASSRFKQ